MRWGARETALAATFAALYAVAVVALAPISFYVPQVRLADALLPLSMLFGAPSIVGLALGCFISNLFGLPGWAGLVDAIFGSLANLLGCWLAYTLVRGKDSLPRYLAGCVIIAFVVTLIVGTYLSVLLSIPLMACYWAIFTGSLVSVVVLGYPLLLALRALGLRKRV